MKLLRYISETRFLNIQTDGEVTTVVGMSVLCILHCHVFIPSMLRSTHFGSSSFTLNDNIFTNKPRDVYVSGVLIADVSG